MQNKKWKFGIGIGIILVVAAWEALSGFQQSKTYYVTVNELTQGQAARRHVRLGGVVTQGSSGPGYKLHSRDLRGDRHPAGHFQRRRASDCGRRLSGGRGVPRRKNSGQVRFQVSGCARFPGTQQQAASRSDERFNLNFGVWQRYLNSPSCSQRAAGRAGLKPHPSKGIP